MNSENEHPRTPNNDNGIGPEEIRRLAREFFQPVDGSKKFAENDATDSFSEDEEDREIPSGYITTDELVLLAGISESTLFSRIKSMLPKGFGEILVIKGKNYYSPIQQQMAGYRVEKDIPEGYRTRRDLLLEFGLTAHELRQCIALIDPNVFGPVQRIRESGVPGPGRKVFSPEQQEMIGKQVETLRKLGSAALRAIDREKE